MALAVRAPRAGAASSATTRTPRCASLHGSVQVKHTLAERGAKLLWERLHTEPYINALGALTGNQAMQQARAGLQGDLPLRLAGGGGRQQCGPDVSRPDSSIRRARCPTSCARSTTRSAAPTKSRPWKARVIIDWFAPIVADAEAGFGGPLNAFELMKSMIEAGAAGVHFEDQLASEKKCGHLGGKVLLPISAVLSLQRAQCRASCCGRGRCADGADCAHGCAFSHSFSPPTSTCATARSSRASARRIASSASRRIAAWIMRSRAAWRLRPTPISTGRKPRSRTLRTLERFAKGNHAQFPGKLLAYNCSPSFNWL